MFSKKQDFFLALAFPPIAALVSLFFTLNFVESLVFFYILPSLYFSIRIPGQIKKTLAMAFTVMLFFTTFDYIWELTGAWAIPSFFSFKLFGIFTIESFLWSFLWAYFIIIVYEYFFEHDKPIEGTRRPLWQFLVVTVALFTFLSVIVLFVNKNIFVPYSYLVLGGPMCVIPLLYLLVHYPKLRGKFLAAGCYFSYATVIYELTALHLKYWYFPNWGEFIGSITILHTTFPLEEFFLWIVLGGVGVMAWYELLDDDRK